MSGVKHDQEKPDMSLLSSIAMVKIAQVMTFGKKKYSANNWRGGIVYTRLLAATLRHVFAYLGGESTDPETGLSHLAHASCCLMMVLEFEETNPSLDDRYKQPETKSDSVIVMPPGANGGGTDKHGTYYSYPDGSKRYYHHLVTTDGECKIFLEK